MKDWNNEMLECWKNRITMLKICRLLHFIRNDQGSLEWERKIQARKIRVF